MILVNNLTKFYGTFKALDNVSLKIESGTIFGLIGPNGSGKTTFIKLLVGSLKPSYGEIKVFDLEPVKERSKLIKIIGYMPQDFALYEDLSVEENIKFFAKLHSVKDYEWVIEFAELENKRNVEVYKLSGGLKRRVSFACSIVHNPTLLFLDEPTAALDPHLREKFWNYFLRLKEEGKTIFVSTHLMDEAFKCDLLGLIYKGKMLIVDKPENILKI
ncbi:MAG: ABC transporter ATP-binding protein [candidate division WOR-3 bacterium]